MSIVVEEESEGVWKYRLYFRWPSGKKFMERKRVPVTHIKKREAEAWVKSRMHKLIQAGEEKYEEVRSPAKAVPTIQELGPDYVKLWLKVEDYKPRTVAEYERILESEIYPAFGAMRLDQITFNTVQEFKRNCIDEELSTKTVNNSLSVLSQLLTYSVRSGKLPGKPEVIEMYELAKVEMHRYEDEEYDQLLTAAAALGPRAHALVLLGGDAGLRRGEMVALEWAAIDFRRNVLHVRLSESKGLLSLPKGGKARDVEMSDNLRSALQALKEMRLAGQRVLVRDPTYRWDHGQGPVTDRTLQSWMEHVEKTAEMPETGNLHILRHTFCSRLAERGVGVKAIKELAGHADIKTTERYMHLSPNAKKDAIARLNECNGVAKEKGPGKAPVLSAI